MGGLRTPTAALMISTQLPRDCSAWLAGIIILQAFRGFARPCEAPGFSDHSQVTVALNRDNRGYTLSSAAALRLSAYFRTLRVPSDAATKFAPGHTSMPAQQRPALTPGLSGNCLTQIRYSCWYCFTCITQLAQRASQ